MNKTPADAGMRFAGYLIDSTITASLMLLICLAGIFLTPTLDGYLPANQIPVGLIVAFLAMPFTPLVYGAGLAFTPWRITPGKRLLKLDIIDANGAPATVGRLAARELLKWLTGIFVIPYAWILYNSERRALWDIWTGVTVVRR